MADINGKFLKTGRCMGMVAVVAAAAVVAVVVRWVIAFSMLVFLIQKSLNFSYHPKIVVFRPYMLGSI